MTARGDRLRTMADRALGTSRNRDRNGGRLRKFSNISKNKCFKCFNK